MALAMVGSACGNDSPPLSAAGERGKEVAADKGCQSCHGNQGQGGVGPAWQGLAGSDVELDDGTVVAADDRYLRESIVEPDATKVAGYTVSMPSIDLDPSEVDALVAYIEDLKDVQ
jgi:cytochrome c oxidase subunit 2